MTEFEHQLSKITLESMAQYAFHNMKCSDCEDRKNREILCSTQRCIENYTKFLNSEHKEV